MPVKQISVEQAKQAMDDSADILYIDVRTPEEFEGGHPPNAINIPVVFPDPATQQMSPNPDFMRVVKAHVPEGKQVILGCKMGGRSQMAADLMDGAGYTDVSNMPGGFGGALDPMGQLVVPGWTQLEFPIEMKVDEQNGYEGLKLGAE